MHIHCSPSSHEIKCTEPRLQYSLCFLCYSDWYCHRVCSCGTEVGYIVVPGTVCSSCTGVEYGGTGGQFALVVLRSGMVVPGAGRGGCAPRGAEKVPNNPTSSPYRFPTRFPVLIKRCYEMLGIGRAYASATR
eukprot:2966758-Rhodomonas_salina.1